MGSEIKLRHYFLQYILESQVGVWFDEGWISKSQENFKVSWPGYVLVMGRVPENPTRGFFTNPNPKKNLQTRPDPNPKNCKPDPKTRKNSRSFISSKIRVKLSIFWWELGFFRKKISTTQDLFYSVYFFWLFFGNNNFFWWSQGLQKFFWNFYNENGIFRPQNPTRNPTRTRCLLPEPDPNPKEKSKTRPDPNPKEKSKTRTRPEPDFWQPDTSLITLLLLRLCSGYCQNLTAFRSFIYLYYT